MTPEIKKFNGQWRLLRVGDVLKVDLPSIDYQGYFYYLGSRTNYARKRKDIRFIGLDEVSQGHIYYLNPEKLAANERGMLVQKANLRKKGLQADVWTDKIGSLDHKLNPLVDRLKEFVISWQEGNN